MESTNTADSNYIQYVTVLLKELALHKGKVAISFAIFSMITLVVGIFYPLKYQSSTTIYADQQNIIKPLLAGQASVTRVQDRARVVREVIYSPRILKKVAIQSQLLEGGETEREIEQFANSIRPGLTVSGIGPNYIKINYMSNDPRVAHRVVANVADLFIQDSSESKRNESREAYLFIDRQVKSYKTQLQEAEDRLKKFNESSTDGTEASTKSRIATLRGQVENLQINIDEVKTRIEGIETELAKENQYVEKRFKTDVYRERLLAAQEQLQTLRLAYTETYPDIVMLKHQIEDMKEAIREVEAEPSTNSGSSSSNSTEPTMNPLYERLRTNLAAAKVDLKTKQRRLVATEELMQQEYARLKRIAASQAELSELTRDYNVTKSIYEDMLSRKEKARLSMTLDVEGQGVNYKIQEPASFPLAPVGLRFLHFVLLGPLVGLMVPIGLLFVYTQIDPRVRFIEKFGAMSGVPVLGNVPHFSSPVEKRKTRNEYLALGAFVFLVLAAYATVVLLKVKGFLV